MAAQKNAFAMLFKGSKENNGGLKTAKEQKIEADVVKGNARIEAKPPTMSTKCLIYTPLKAILTSLGARPASDFTCSIISKGRPDNVPANLALFKGKRVL